MSKENGFCPNCLNETGDTDVCPYCGFDLRTKQDDNYLPFGTLLAGRYMIGLAKQHSGDGVTYKARDMTTGKPVDIREFFPDGMAVRENGNVSCFPENRKSFNKLKQDFLNLWNNLKNLKSLDNIVTVSDVFEAKQTSYAVVIPEGVMTFEEYISSKENNKLSFSEAESMLSPLIGTIETLHNAGIIHAGISADNLIVCSGNRLKLSGFEITSARRDDDYKFNKDIIKNYSASEQYIKTDELGKYTDVYSFASVLYRCVTGIKPEDSEDRLINDTLSIPAYAAEELPEYAIAALIGALQLNPEDRTQDFYDLKKDLDENVFNLKKQTAVVKSEESGNGLDMTILKDPLSEMDDGDFEHDKSEKREKKEQQKQTEPVILDDNKTSVPIVTKDNAAAKEKANSTASIILLAVCIVVVMLIFFSLLALTGIISFNVLSSDTQNAQVFEMPDFNGVDKSDAKINDCAQKYELHITLQPENSDEPANTIIRQNIAAGTKVAKGSNLILYYSKGESTVQIPDELVGIPFTETVYYLGKLNLTYNIVEQDNPGTEKAGSVASLSPAPGSIVKEGTEITVNVWGDVKSSDNSGSSDSGSHSESTDSNSILGSIFGELQNDLASIIG